MLICGGFNVYPAIIEAAVNDLPDVVDSVAAGLPDERLGEIPVVAVVLQPGAALELDPMRDALRSNRGIRTSAPASLRRRNPSHAQWKVGPPGYRHSVHLLTRRLGTGDAAGSGEVLGEAFEVASHSATSQRAG